MTIIFAVKESDKGILLGADTCDTDEFGIKTTSRKLRRINNFPVAWSGSGNSAIFREFNNWLEDYKWPPINWDEFEEAVRNQLADLNGKQRAFCKRSGVDWKDDFGLNLLLIAWFQGKPYMRIYDNAGMKSSCLEDDFGAIGSGSPVITVAWRTIESIPLNGSCQKRFEYLLHIAARMGQYCAEPIDIWRVTENGIEEVLELGTRKTAHK